MYLKALVYLPSSRRLASSFLYARNFSCIMGVGVEDASRRVSPSLTLTSTGGIVSRAFSRSVFVFCSSKAILGRTSWTTERYIASAIASDTPIFLSLSRSAARAAVSFSAWAVWRAEIPSMSARGISPAPPEKILSPSA